MKVSPELTRYLDETPHQQVIDWFMCLTRHLGQCIDPDDSCRPLDPDVGMHVLTILAQQVQTITEGADTVRDTLLNRLARCTLEVIRSGCYEWVLGNWAEHRPIMREWAGAYGELVADGVAATLANATALAP